MKPHKVLFVGTLISGMFVSAITFTFRAQAQTNNCPARPNIGHRCYQDRNLYARSGYPGEDTQGWTYSPPPGYRLMDYQEVVQSRFGEGGGINVNLVRGGTFSQLSSSIASSNRVLADYRGRIESYARFPISGVPITVGGETEVIDRTLRENERRLQMLSSDYSNVDRVQVSVTVRGRCTRTAPLVGCVDNQGGQYQGYLRFSLEYVGNPSDIIAANDAIVRRAQNSLAVFQRQASQPAPQQSSSACVSVDSRSGWQRFNLPGNFTRVASVSGGWSVDTRSYSPVGSSGHTGRDAEALAPYNQYKFDQRYPFGALLINN